MVQTILQLLYYALFFFAPLIMYSKTSELFEFNKMIFIYVITTLVLFFWVLKMILNRRIILKKTVFDIPLLLFVGSQLISTVFSIDRHTSFYGYYGRFNGGFLSIIAYTILYFAFTSNLLMGVNVFESIKKLFKISLISSFFVMLWGLPGRLGYDLSCYVFMGQLNNSCWTDQFHPEERVFSTLGQPNWLGAFLAINFFIAVFFLLKSIFIQKDSYLKRIVLYGYLFLNFSSILFTRSRSALAPVIIGLIILTAFLFIYFKGKIDILRRQSKQILIFFVLIICSIVFFKTGIQSVDRYLDLSFLHVNKKVSSPSVPVPQRQPTGAKIVISESFDIRKIVWKGAIDLGNKYPLFGTGVETFAYAYYFVRPIAHNMTSEWDYLYNKAHNEYLNYLATTGYIGLFAYVIMIGSFIYLLVKTLRRENKNLEHVFLLLSLFLSYLSILITNFFGFSTTTINLFFYFFPAVIMMFYVKKDTIKNNSLQSKPISMNQWLSIGIVTIGTITILVFFMNYFLADITYAQADVYSKKGDYQTAASLLTHALKLKYEHVYEDKLSYTLANLAVVASYQKQTDLTSQIITLAETYNKKSINSSPKNVLYWKTRAKNQYLFYQISLDKEKIVAGIKALNEAQKLSPTDPKIPYSLAIFYSLLYDEEKNKVQKELYKNQSVQEIEASIHLKPDYQDSYVLKDQLLKNMGFLN